MGTIFDDMFQELENKGKAEGRTEGRAEEIISNCKSKGYSDQSTLEVPQQRPNIVATKAMEFLQEFGTHPIS